MSRRWALLFHIASIAIVCAPAAVAAQTSPCPAPAEVAVAAGVGQNDHADASASPAQFEGRGFESTVAATFDLGSFCISSGGGFGARSLRPVAGSFGRERAIDGGVGFDVLRRLHDLPIAAGVALRGDLSATSHTFDDASHTTSTFRLATISLGPAFRVSLPLRTARIDVSASRPLVALVDHSYNGVWSGDEALHFRPQAWPRLHDAEAAVFVERPLTARTGAMLGYSVRASRYDDAQPVRALSQRVLAGVSWHIASTQR